ncbi:MAG TPA: tetratricopeptide repeat protein [Geobacteraceae bacterium]
MTLFARLRPHLPIILFLAAITAAVYGRALGHQFLLDWDDQLYVTANPTIRGFSIAHLREAFSRFYVGNYAPLQILSYMLDYTLWGVNPAGFILTNLLLHLVNGLLCYALVVRLTGERWQGAIAALLFLVHPVQVETAVWVSQRKTLLAMALFLAALHGYLSYRQPGRPRHWGAYGWSIVTFGGALLAKSVAVVLPPLLLLYDLVVLPRHERRGWLWDKLPFLLAAAVVGGVALFSQAPEQEGGRVTGYYGGSLFGTVCTMLPVLVRYLGLLLWPARLAAFYDPPVKNGVDGEVVMAGLCLLALAGGILYLGRRRPRLLFWSGLIVLGLLPVSQLVPLVTLMNDRYLYLPMAGVAGLVVELLTWLADGLPVARRRLVQAVGGAALIALALVAFVRVGVWRDSLTLWQDAYAKTATSETVCFSLGAVYQRAGDLAAARRCYERALSLGAHSRDALQNLVILHFENGTPADAAPYLEELVRRFPGYAPGYVLQGDYFLRRGDLPAAEQAYRQGLSLKPDSGGALANLGTVYLQQGRLAEAGDCFAKAQAVGYESAEFRVNRAALAARSGRTAEALAELRQAFGLGFRNGYAIAANPAFASLKGNPEFERLLAGGAGQ